MHPSRKNRGDVEEGRADTPSISVDEYFRLPCDVRHELDCWLADEGLLDERLTWFRLLEGAIEAERYVRDAEGRIVVHDREALRVMQVYRIKTPPPRAALK